MNESIVNTPAVFSFIALNAAPGMCVCVSVAKLVSVSVYVVWFHGMQHSDFLAITGIVLKIALFIYGVQGTTFRPRPDKHTCIKIKELSL